MKKIAIFPVLFVICIFAFHNAFAENQTNTSIRVGNENYTEVQENLKNFLIAEKMKTYQEQLMANFTAQQQATHKQLYKMYDIFDIANYEKYLKSRPNIANNLMKSEIQYRTEYVYVNVVLGNRQLVSEMVDLHQQRINIEDAAKIPQTNISWTR